MKLNVFDNIILSVEGKDKKDMKYYPHTPDERYTLAGYRKAGLSMARSIKLSIDTEVPSIGKSNAHSSMNLSYILCCVQDPWRVTEQLLKHPTSF